MDIIRTLEQISVELNGTEAPRPSGQLAGHAGGLVFEAMAHEMLVSRVPGQAFRHYEALNVALESELRKGTSPNQVRFGEPALHYLVSRGVKATKNWGPNSLFEEKQNDTAESIVFSDPELKFNSPSVSLIDIKSQNGSKSSQPPNIISARKLYTAATLVLEEQREPKFDILYLGVKFQPTEDKGIKILKAENWRAIDLFKIDPSSLYINWAAALQVQFHPFLVNQDFDGTRREWFKSFVKNCYVRSLEINMNKRQEELEEAYQLIAKFE